MNLTRDRVRSIGWAFVLTICAAMTLALTFRVNAVKSEVRLAERQIVALRQEKMFLETEFETRANQQQLKALNDVEFGYVAPTSGQYLENERELAALGKERAPGSPAPIRVVRMAMAEDAPSLVAMVSPLTGRDVVTDAAPAPARERVSAATLDARLSRVDPVGALTSAARE